MPQLSRGEGAGDDPGDDLGASDELISFKHEGEQEEEEEEERSRDGARGGRDLDEVKSSLVRESETSQPEAGGPSEAGAELQGRATHSQRYQEALRRQQDGGLFQPSPYVGYPFFMIPDLGNLCGPYLANRALTTSSHTYLPFQWPLIDVSGRTPIRDSAAPAHLPSSRATPLHPLLAYSPEAFSPQRASPGFSPEAAGASRSPHAACYPVSPGGVSPIPHPLSWLQSQYPLPGFSPAALAMTASMSSLVSPRLLAPPPHAVAAGVKQEPEGSCQQHRRATPHVQLKEEEKKSHIKKPLNAFMLYMRDERPRVMAQCNVKESATINQILGQRWHSLSKEDQAKYYELARKERILHSKLYPGWSARDNYGKRKKRKRTKSQTLLEAAVSSDDFPLQLKRPPAPVAPPGPDDLSQQPSHTRPHAVSHLTHTHLSQASPASSLDSPATPTTALASPAAPAATHTDRAPSSWSPYGEQLQPLSLTTKPHRTSPPPFSPRFPPFLVPPPTSAHHSAVSSHGAFAQRASPH